MSDFRWNSGGSLHGKDWEEHLPTDSAVSIALQLSISVQSVFMKWHYHSSVII
jgi:hypothetical protein